MESLKGQDIYMGICLKFVLYFVLVDAGKSAQVESRWVP